MATLATDLLAAAVKATLGKAEAQPNVFMNILTEGSKTGINTKRVSEAREWFRSKAQETTIKSPARTITSGGILTSKARQGFMYMFQYDPKTKKDLPYYDRYPVVFPFRVTKEGFYGLNLHYLPYTYRAKLMDSLYMTVSNKKYDETTKLRISYQLLESTSKFRFFKPCVKQYLNSHVKSRMLFVPAEQWDIALFLPVGRFSKTTETKVFADSRKEIRENAAKGILNGN